MGFPVTLDIATQNHIDKTLSLVPSLYHAELMADYENKHAQSLRDANLYFLSVQDATKGLRLWMDYDDVKTLAERRANYCIRLDASQGALFCERVGIEPPTAKEEKGVYLRLSNPKWWSRKLFTKLKRDRELFAIQSGKVQKLASPYCSQFAFEAVRDQDELNQQLMKEIKLVCGDEEITLFDAWESSTANPYNRFVELVTRVKGFEDYADTKDHQAQFITITAPSKFHAYRSSGHKNPKYQGATPRDTHQHLMGVWQKVRAQFAKQSINVYGLRIVEPHHDATPHYHMVMFGTKDELQQANTLMRDYFTQEDKAELKDESVRFDVEVIDKAKGSAVGYVIKYLAKNILAESINLKAGEDHDTGKSITETAGKVVAWARTWGIRQFTFFGGAGVSVWRELRRLDKTLDNDLLEQLRQSAHESDWGKYQGLMDCMDVKPYSVESFNADTGELILNQYQEITQKIKGIQDGLDVHITRAKEWRVIFNATTENQ